MEKDIDTFDFGITKITEKIEIERREKIDSAIIGAMHHILSEKGIERKFILYEENLVEACKNYIEGYASVKAEVAKEFIEAVDEMMDLVCAMTGLSFTYLGKYAKLKKKYTEGEHNDRE